MLFFKKNKKKEYSEHLFRYIVKNILDETVDRKILFELIREKLKPVVGKDFVQQFLIEINRIEKQLDRRKIEYWTQKAQDAREKEIFH
jgi:hypothetical protein